MARAKVTYSEDAIQITFRGDKRSPEPSTGVIKFPGGHVEVSRCSDGKYWAHIAVDSVGTIEGRIDRVDRVQAVEDMEDAEKINHIAILVSIYK